ncbi:unnamed protein product [Mytilus edulis]|uniref:Uncharacterized protein n=1 Tax=Mytilus edulis TaxID=6550 RepID=A0A8S3PVV7_MYTED|nr:unnamed protein product [Mytilus edulis]
MWPGFRCICNKKDVSLICSDQFEIVIETRKTIKDIPNEFSGFKVRQLPYEKQSKEAKIITSCLSKYWNSGVCCDNILIPGKEAESLFDTHSNLSLICSSIIRSAGMTYNHRIQPVKCIQLYCTVKGVIPIGERHFPSSVCEYQTDVLKAVLVSYRNKSWGKKTLLGRISNDIDSRGINVYMPSPTNTPVHCGRVMRRIFDHSDKDKTSIDAALVNIIPTVTIDPHNIIVDQFKLSRSMTELGKNCYYCEYLSMDLNEICIDIASICHSKADLLCPGGFLKIKDRVNITLPEEYVEIQFPPDGGPVQHG